MVILVPLFPQAGAVQVLRAEKAEPGAITDYIAFLRQSRQMNTILQASITKSKLADPPASTTA